MIHVGEFQKAYVKKYQTISKTYPIFLHFNLMKFFIQMKNKCFKKDLLAKNRNNFAIMKYFVDKRNIYVCLGIKLNNVSDIQYLIFFKSILIFHLNINILFIPVYLHSCIYDFMHYGKTLTYFSFIQ